VEKLSDAERNIMLRRVKHGQPVARADEEDGLLKAMSLEQEGLIGPITVPIGGGDCETTLTEKGRALLEEQDDERAPARDERE
jgi:hypothetical protein